MFKIFSYMKNIKSIYLLGIFAFSAIFVGCEPINRTDVTRPNEDNREKNIWKVIVSEIEATSKDPQKFQEEKRLSTYTTASKGSVEVEVACNRRLIYLTIKAIDLQVDTTPIYSPDDEKWAHGFSATFMDSANAVIERLPALRVDDKSYVIKKIRVENFSNPNFYLLLRVGKNENLHVTFNKNVSEFALRCTSNNLPGG